MTRIGRLLMRTLACGVWAVPLVAVSAGVALGQAPQTRVRVSEPVRHGGFAYSGSRWLEGQAAAVLPDTLVLQMANGARLAVPLRVVSELQIRAQAERPWEAVPGGSWLPSGERLAAVVDSVYQASLVQSRPVQPLWSAAPVPEPQTSPASAAGSGARSKLVVYLGGAYHLLPASTFRDDLEGVGLHLSDPGAGSIGVMYWRRANIVLDVALAVYGARDRALYQGELAEAEYRVRSLELGFDRILTDGRLALASLAAAGVATVSDKRQFGSALGTNDQIVAWPFSLGLRLLTRDTGWSGLGAIPFT